MKTLRRHFCGVLTATLLLTSSALLLINLQGAPQSGAQGGVVVEDVKAGSAGERAGIQAGDVIVSWSRGADSGKLESPFAWMDFETEWVPRGSVTLKGLRDSQEHAWKLPDGDPGIMVRPALRKDLVPVWQQCRELKAANCWESLSGKISASDPAWLAPSVGYQKAQSLIAARQFQAADAAFAKAIEQVRSAASEGTPYLLRAWGDEFRERGEWLRVQDCYQRSLEEAMKLTKESLSAAASLHGLANIASQRDDLDTAESYDHEALSVQQRLAPGSLAVARSLNNLAATAAERGDLDQAEGYLQEGLSIWQAVAPSSPDVATNLINLGACERERGDLESAEENLQRALEIQKAVAPEGLLVAYILINLGPVAEGQGDLERAQRCYQEALTILQKLSPDGLDVGASLQGLGSTAEERGDLEGADHYFQRALVIEQREGPDSPGVAACLLDLGRVARAQGRLERAEGYIRQSLVIMQEHSPDSLYVANHLDDLGGVQLDRGDVDAAERDHLQALVIRRRLAPGSRGEAETLHELGLVFNRKGIFDTATTYFAEAVESLERQTAHLGATESVRSSFRAKYAPWYLDLEDALLSKNQQGRAYQVSERSRAQGLRQLLAQRDLLFPADVPKDLQQRRKRNAAEIDRLVAQMEPDSNERMDKQRKRLAELYTEREQIGEQIKKVSPRFASLEYPQPLDLAATRQVLDSGTTLLSYAVGEKHTLLYVVEPAGVEPGLSVFKLPVKEKDLQAKVTEFRRHIREIRPHDRELEARSRELYDLLLRPADDLLAGSERLLIVPDGPLHVLPFAALKRREKEYLVEWKPVHTTVSATVYAELKKVRHQVGDGPTRLVAFGDPRIAGKDAIDRGGNPELRFASQRGFTWGPLRFSRQEVEGIAKLYPGQSRTYLGAEATEERAKALGKDVRIIHFATHGLLDERLPLNSAVVLSIPDKVEEGKDNGLLQVWEIFEQMRLDADLVTLSACDTAEGQELKGEGLIGLTRAFHFAGARSVLATLWGVDDFRTMELMTRFYREWRQGKGKDDALRAAQLELLHSGNGSAPYFWAGFSLSGDWR